MRVRMLLASLVPLLLGQGCPMSGGRIEVTDELRAKCAWDDERMLNAMREIASFRDAGLPYATVREQYRDSCLPPMICAEPCPYDPAAAANKCEACSWALTNQVYYGAP